VDKSTRKTIIMHKILFLILFTISSTAFASDLTLCLGCHNEQNTMNPTIAGQHPRYIEKQLIYFKNDKRINAIMQGISKTLDDNQIKAISIEFSKKEWVNSKNVTKEANKAKGKKLTQSGNCMGCHGGTLRGWSGSNVPRLAGQDKNYLKQAMLKFKKHEHKYYPIMNSMVARYSEQDLDVLADYLSGLGN